MKKPLLTLFATAFLGLSSAPLFAADFSGTKDDAKAMEKTRDMMDRQLAQYDGGAVGAYPPGLVDRLTAQGVEVYLGEPKAA